ncbi:MAG TPA: c-type cytochrome domain-containing protein [Urbifossiella sp.]|jgi:WD40 repeat protein/mono/diheme cytochrome c family protein
MFAKTIPLAVGFLFVSSIPASAADEQRELAVKVQAVFKAHCYRCHGQNGSIEGGLNYLADLSKLVARKKVLPGNADGSRLFKRLDEGTMPPPEENPRPSPAEVALVKKWIDAGAPGAEIAAPRTPVTQGDVLDAILADLEKFDRRGRRFQRYFTFNHLYNAGLSDEELQTYRNALSKLVNSLSWNPRISVPVPIDPSKTVLRIDLRWFLWDAAIWNRMLQEYPYGILDDTIAARAAAVSTATKVPSIRGDWFIGSASRAPLYYDLLQIPSNLGDLERQLRVDAVLNIQQERVTRVGFNGSGISRFNRVLERHDSAQGMYWRTYDFDEPPANLIERVNGNLLPDRRNIFAFPLGPNLVENAFQHAGGEAIFALPNSLHAYILAKADNTRLDKGPIAIVSDPKRPDRAVEAGVSCMSCHVSGIIPKSDQIRDHLAKNPNAFNKHDAELIKALYPAKEKSLEIMQDDAKRYAETVARTGAKVSKFEAVSTITLKYEADLDLPLAAGEVGLSPEAFRAGIDRSETLRKHVGALRSAGGTVSRQIWVQAFGDLVRELHLGISFQANLNGPTLPDNTGELDPLEARGGDANQIAFSADGKRALIASGDRTVRLYDVEGRRDLKRFVGHTASVWAVALSADGTRVLSGGMDGAARLWDATSGTPLQKYAGHDGLVSAAAFTPDGKWAVTGGFDGLVALWKTGNGQEIRRWEGTAKFITAIVVDPNGKTALIAADRHLYLWDLYTGDVLAKFTGHTATATCAVFTDDGAKIISGSDDGTVRIWNVKDGKLLGTLKGHEAAVRSVAVMPGGRWAISGSSDRTLRLWDLWGNVQVAVFRKHTGPVVSAAFLANGTQTLSGDRDLGIFPWRIDKFLTASPPKPAPMIPKSPPAMIPYAKP